jgi:hypothetical protein
MLIIKKEPFENGAHENQSGNLKTVPDGWLAVPPELEAEAAGYLPFILLTVENGVITAVAQGEEPEPEIDIEALRSAKLAELGAATDAAIHAGFTVRLPSSGKEEQFSLEVGDQLNLTAAFTRVSGGAPYYLYHSDTILCRTYPAEDIVAMATAAEAHKLYHTTYCNHLNSWVRRTEDAEELAAIFYGAELPKDLAEHLEEVLYLAQKIM